jgi:hypothetical protein
MLDYDWSDNTGTGKPKRNHLGEPHLRSKLSPPPCNKCEKKSPAEEWRHVLSAKNRQTYSLAWKVHATNGEYLTPAMKRDLLFMDNLAVVLRLIQTYERHDLAERIAIKTYGMGRR